MANMYNYDGIVTDMNERIELQKATLEKWKNVQFITKKDGKPFKTLSKNIVNAKLYSISYAMQPGENELRVNVWTPTQGYRYDTIKCYELVKYLEDPVKLEKKENYQIKQTYLEQIYTFDIDDIKQAVEKHIAYLEKDIAAMVNQLENAKQAYETFLTGYKELVKTLETNVNRQENATLFYNIIDTVKDRYMYL